MPLTPRQVLSIDLISAEPHKPHVLVEKGDMTLGEYDQHLKGKADFIRGTKKGNSAEWKVSHGWQSWGALGTWSH